MNLKLWLSLALPQPWWRRTRRGAAVLVKAPTYMTARMGEFVLLWIVLILMKD
jgi:hypothetical protein